MIEEIIPVNVTERLTVNAVAGYTDFSKGDEIVFIFAPHPLLGGDLNNNVVDAIFKCYAKTGKIAVKLSYRGVDSGYVNGEPFLSYWDRLENSKQFDDIVKDTHKIVSEVRAQFSSGASLFFISYSFGNIIALELKTIFKPKGFVGIAPPVNDYDFERLFNLNHGTKYILSENDVFCSMDTINSYSEKYGLKLFKCGDDHFFRGFEHQLSDMVMKILEE